LFVCLFVCVRSVIVGVLFHKTTFCTINVVLPLNCSVDTQRSSSYILTIGAKVSTYSNRRCLKLNKIHLHNTVTNLKMYDYYVPHETLEE